MGLNSRIEYRAPGYMDTSKGGKNRNQAWGGRSEKGEVELLSVSQDVYVEKLVLGN